MLSWGGGGGVDSQWLRYLQWSPVLSSLLLYFFLSNDSYSGIPSANGNILLDGRIWSRSRDVEWVMLSQRYMISICFTFFLSFFSLRTDFSGSERFTQPKYCSLWLKTRECAVIVSIIRMWFPTGEVPLVLFFWNKFVGLVFSRERQWLRVESFEK